MSDNSGQYQNKNTAHGEFALHGAIASGDSAGFDNTAYGYLALQSLSPGVNENTAVGSEALRYNTTGENTAVGAHAGTHVAGTGNTGVGNWALRYLNGGNNNTAVGHRALAGDELTETEPVTKPNGDRNTAVGANTLRNNPDSDDNTAVGYDVLVNIEDTGNDNTGVGSGALREVRNGTSNVGVGKNAGLNIFSGSNNTFIGANSNSPDAGASYRTAIGAGSSVAQDNSVVIGRTGVNRDFVGLGSTTPEAPLHLVGVPDRAALIVDGGQINKVTEINTAIVPSGSVVNPSSYIVIVGGVIPLGYVVNLVQPTNAITGQTYIIKNAGTVNPIIVDSLPGLGSNEFYTSANVDFVTLAVGETARFVYYGGVYFRIDQ